MFLIFQSSQEKNCGPNFISEIRLWSQCMMENDQWWATADDMERWEADIYYSLELGEVCSKHILEGGEKRFTLLKSDIALYIGLESTTTRGVSSLPRLKPQASYMCIVLYSLVMPQSQLPWCGAVFIDQLNNIFTNRFLFFVHFLLFHLNLKWVHG